MDRLADGWMHGRTDRRMDGWTDGWMDARTDRWMGEQMGRRMNGHTDKTDGYIERKVTEMETECRERHEETKKEKVTNMEKETMTEQT